ncbi:hypothetical protein Leryth_001758 [Lithospermum erythrorhizon]|nr:hypothetical protein Leryth_001758 [Lithospermum erythrorhizon]
MLKDYVLQRSKCNTDFNLIHSLQCCELWGQEEWQTDSILGSPPEGGVRLQDTIGGVHSKGSVTFMWCNNVNVRGLVSRLIARPFTLPLVIATT